MSPYKNPELMVIGDSLPQGCRSMTVQKDFCSESYSAQAARLTGIDFQSPEHPFPVLFDLEAIAGDLIFQGLGAILGGVGQNYQDWRDQFSAPEPKSPIYFDNLAVAGFTLEDTLGESFQAGGVVPATGTPALATAWLDKTPVISDVRQQYPVLSDLHVAVNARYVLNPGNDPELMSWSQLDWVEDRQPKRLIVHVGHNNGLYAIGSKGDFDDWNSNWGKDAGAPALRKYQVLVERLAESLPDTQILFIGLPKIGAVSNLMPLGNARLPDDLQYFASYETQFPSRVAVDGAVIKDADQQIAAVNTAIEELVLAADAGAKRLSYFSAYDFFALHDTKNVGETPISSLGYTIDNNYISGVFKRQPGRASVSDNFKWEFARGGLQSLDGMHPSSIGYASLAFEIARFINGQAVSAATQKKFLEKVTRRERLVTMFPQGLDTVQKILSKVSHPNQTSDEAVFNEVVKGMSYVTD